MIHLLRTIVLGAVVVLAWVVWDRFDDTLQAGVIAERRAVALEGELTAAHEREARLGEELTESLARSAELSTALRHLKVDTRRARLTVLSQRSHDEAAGAVVSRVRFQELASDGEPLGEPVDAELPGRVAYVESLVIKFDDELVASGDPWRGASLCLFRRLFSELQRPEDGVLLDPPGQEPAGYSDADLEPADELWRNFWDLADDPAAAAARGVRALHGEAPFVELRDGRSYLVELRASGGLTIRREP